MPCKSEKRSKLIISVHMWFLINRYSCVPMALAEGLDIKRSHTVRQIEISPTGVVVTTATPKGNTNLQTFKADAVLCTLPLGVLKESIQPTVGTACLQFFKSHIFPNSNIKIIIMVKFDPVIAEWITYLPTKFEDSW